MVRCSDCRQMYARTGRWKSVGQGAWRVRLFVKLQRHHSEYLGQGEPTFVLSENRIP